MDIKLLRAFVTLSHLGWYHLAADKLCITQPALTKQIQTLEFIYGITLFQRGRHGAKLTIAGASLIKGATDVLKRYDDFYDEVTSISRGKTGKLTIGFGISSFRQAPELAASFRNLYPNVELSLNDMPSSEQFIKLTKGLLQIGFVRLPAPEQLESKILAKEKLVLAVSKENKTYSTNSIDLLKKSQLLQLSTKRGEGLSAQISLFLSKNKITPQIASTSDDIQTLLALVSGGNGVALLPASVVHILPIGVKLLALEGEHTNWNTGISWNPRLKDPVRDNFLNIVNKK